MNYGEFNEFCQSLPATSYVMQWGGSHVWKVGDKVFALFSSETAGGWNKNGKSGITFRVSDHNFQILQDQPGFRPAPYLASRGMKWIQQYDEFDSERLQYYLQESHRIISLNLTRKKQRELGLNQ